MSPWEVGLFSQWHLGFPEIPHRLDFLVNDILFRTFKNQCLPSSLMISYVQVQTVTLIPGDGIGPEISAAVMKIFDAAKVRGLDTHLQR